MNELATGASCAAPVAARSGPLPGRALSSIVHFGPDRRTRRREELAKATQKSSLQTMVSPVDGTISQLAIHTLGGVVEAAKPIMAGSVDAVRKRACALR